MTVRQDIAIVGLGCIFPGATDPDQFWSLISSAISVSGEPPADRWPESAQAFCQESLTADKIISSRAGFVDSIPAIKSPMPEGIDSTGLDPLFHLLLHAGHQAWDDAVTDSINRSQCGVILGQIVLPSETVSNWSDALLARATQAAWGEQRPPLPDFNPLNRHVAGLPAGLLAASLNLGGGASCLDAACASSLYALKLAADELREGRRDAMLVGGLSRPDSLYTQMGFSHLHALSPSGQCRPFSRHADGLLVGEGAGMVVLKRLEDALECGDHIYATLPGIGLSNDLGGNLMHPDSEGQLRAMRQAYAHADWQPDHVDLIECHGTGTPTGDRIELASLQHLWSDAQAPESKPCVIGSVKSNIGHLLTAAGIAGLIKVLLALQAKQLPPCANVDQPLSDLDSTDSQFRILNQVEAWPTRGEGIPRRAAVSAFGFGGINAHVLVEEWNTGSVRVQAHNSPSITANTPATNEPIAIVGLSGQFGPWTDPGSLTARLLGDPEYDQSPGHGRALEGNDQYSSHSLDKIEIDALRFRIPPKELEQLLPQQALMLQTAADALDDAGIATDHHAHLHSGIYIGIELDLNTCNFHWRWQCKQQLQTLQLANEGDSEFLTQLKDAATPYLNADRTMGALGGIVASRIARWLGAGAGSFTVSCEQASALKALEIAMRALRREEINLAVVGGVDLNVEPRNLRAQQIMHGQTLIGEGAGAVVLKRHSDALRDGDRIYCLLRGVSQRSDNAGLKSPLPEHYLDCLDEALSDAGMDTIQPGLVEFGGVHSQSALALNTLVASLNQCASDISPPPPLAASISSRVVGDTAAATGIASLLRVALCLHYRTLPVANISQAQIAANDSSTFYYPLESSYWLRNRSAGPRHAVICVDNLMGGSTHLIAEGVDSQASSPLTVPSLLLCVYGKNKVALVQAIDRCRKLFQQQSRQTPAEIIDHWHQLNVAETDSRAVTIVGQNETEFLALLDAARECVEAGTPAHKAGIFYEPQPLTDNNDRLAFVFPGSGNHYRGMSRQLSLPAARVLDKNDSRYQNLLEQFANGAFWQPPHIDEQDHIKLLCAQIWSSTFVYDIFHSLGVTGEAMIGYSLGETASLFASGCWPDRDTMLARIRDTDLFTHHLGCGYAAVREHWGLKDTDPVDWRIAMIQAPVARVREMLAGPFADERIYLLIINTENECVIGGDGATLARVTAALDVIAHPINGVTTVHCEVVQSVAEAYRTLHLQQTQAVEGITHYSCHWGQAYDVDRDSCADSILGMALEAFDFKALIEKAYADGVRLFVETGPGDACARMIDNILGDRPHFACSASHSRGNEYTHLLQALAGIIAHGVKFKANTWVQHHPVSDRRQTRKQTLTLAPGLRSWQVPNRPGPDLNSKTPVNIPQAQPRSAPMPQDVPALAVNEQWSAPVVHGMLAVLESRHQAHQAFLEFQTNIEHSLNEVLQLRLSATTSIDNGTQSVLQAASTTVLQNPSLPDAAVAFDRAQCLRFAVGGIAEVLGSEFADIDSHPTRVRLPDEPLMLVDRIISIEGQAGTLGPARIITEHDIHPNAWYLDGNRIPTCIAVEAGQADLFLSAWLGIDRVTRGEAVYRLLDANITFHDQMPGPGVCIRYDIRINRFFTLGTTHLFQFEFDASVNGQPLLTMRDGSAGFFTPSELAAGQGIVGPKIYPGHPSQAITTDHSAWLSPKLGTDERYSDQQMDALRAGDLSACFPRGFDSLDLAQAATLPAGRMRLVHRVLDIQAPHNGQPGQITGEADIHPDDWFLTCHFIDDQVMPGTLMYECCLHTLRIYLLRMGWIGEKGQVAYQSVPGYCGKLKCRGQVIASTRTVQYQIKILKTSFLDDGTPYAIADALMLAEGHPIVEMQNMSVCLFGLKRDQIEALWLPRPQHTQDASTAASQRQPSGTALFDQASILAYAEGRPSDGFGDRYRIFDQERVLARLPRPPYLFMDQVEQISDCDQWQLSAGGEIESTHKIQPQDWYFAANRQHSVPLAILMEITLQPCGWLAAYLGSALTSETDLSFRNLDGQATLLRPITEISGQIRASTRINKVSSSGGMIIQSFSVSLNDTNGPVYQCETVFGFFSKTALAQQIGIREAKWYAVETVITTPSAQLPYPTKTPFPDSEFAMLDHLSVLSLTGGRHGLGWVEGHAKVDPEAWYFKAHFYQDPVIPGSLGIESMAQLLKVYALERWSHLKNSEDPNSQFQCPACHSEMRWSYRGQVVPSNERVSVQIHISQVDSATSTLIADGILAVDGRIIYSVENLSLTLRGGA